MPKSETLNKFIEMVESNQHDKAMEEFYTFDASIQENQSEPRQGLDNLVVYEKKMLGKAKSIHSKCIHPVFVDGDTVVIRWVFHFEWKDGRSSHIEEIAYQTWRGEKICNEQFFYDPQQFIPK